MAQNDTFRRYLDAGMAFTQLTRERAEEFVKDLVKAGEVRRKETEEVIEALLERSRRNTEDLVGIIRTEVADQLRNLGLEDVARRAGLGDRAKGAAGRADAKAADAADAVASSSSSSSKATATPAAKKRTAAKKQATPVAGSPLVVPGSPKKVAAKKLIVPPAAAAKKTSSAKKGAAASGGKAAATKKSAPKKS